MPLAAAMQPRDPGIVAALVRCLGSDDPELRWRAALGIGWSSGSPVAGEAVPSLVERLADPNVTVRAFAAAALMRIAPRGTARTAAVATLEADRNAFTRRIAALVVPPRQEAQVLPSLPSQSKLSLAAPEELLTKLRTKPRAASRPSSR